MAVGIFGGQWTDGSGFGTIAGDVTISGDLVVTGTINTGGTGDGEIVDAMNILNFGETGAGVGGAGISGLEIERGTETNYRIIFDESDDTFKVGLVGSMVNVLLANGSVPATGIIDFQAGVTVSGANLGVGVGSASAFGLAHVRSGASGAASANAGADEFIVEGTTDAGLSILTGTTSTGRVMFGRSTDLDAGQLNYNHNDNSFSIITNSTTAITIDSSGNLNIPGGNLNVTGNIIVSGTVDGVDVAAHKSAYDAHVADATIHFTEASIVHQNISGAGTNTHAQIDTAITNATNHIANATLHFTEASIDHGSIAGLADDDHTQYSLADGSRAFSGNIEMQNGIYVSSGNISSGIASTSAFGLGHIRSAASGAASVSINGDELVLEGSGNSGLTVLSGAASNGGIFFGDSGSSSAGQIIYRHATDELNLTTSATVQMVIDSSGQVGIGVTSSLLGDVHIRSASSGVGAANAGADELIVEGSGDSGISILSGTTSTGRLFFGKSTDTDAGQLNYDQGSNTFTFLTNSTTAASLDASGNLDVVGNITVGGTVDGIDIATDVGANTTHRTSNGSDHTYINQDVTTTGEPTFVDLTLAKSTAFAPSSNTDTALVLQGAYGGGIKFEDTNNAGIWVDNSGSKMHFTTNKTTTFGSDGQITLDDGDLGIGDSSPLARLHVKTSDAGSFTPAANYDELLLESSGNTGMTILSGSTSTGSIAFAKSTDDDECFMKYDHSTQDYSVTVRGNANLIVDQYSVSTGARLIANNSEVSQNTIIGTGNTELYTASVISAQCHRSSSTSYQFFSGVADANGTPDTKFRVDGDGSVYSDTGTYGTGADYAEFFESADGNVIEKGTCVIIENGLIREALENEEADGVISANPGVVGNSAELNWNGRFLKDDFGEKSVDEDGNFVVNPDFDPEVEYIPRSERDEWHIVGLLGQLPVKKGQIVNPNWKLIKNISETVDLYLVK